MKPAVVLLGLVLLLDTAFAAEGKTLTFDVQFVLLLIAVVIIRHDRSYF